MAVSHTLSLTVQFRIKEDADELATRLPDGFITDEHIGLRVFQLLKNTLLLPLGG